MKLKKKIVNDLNQGLEVNSRDYVRITVNGSTKELFAPDIHNDPVEVQAISTKNTRVGLAINETDKNIELRVGEINGEKQNLKNGIKSNKARAIFRISFSKLIPHNHHGDTTGKPNHYQADHILRIISQKNDG